MLKLVLALIMYMTIPDISEKSVPLHSAAYSDFCVINPEVTEDAREKIVRLAESAIIRNYGKENYRVSLEPRWIPGKVESEDPDRILSVQPAGEISRYTNFDVHLAGRNRAVQVQFRLEIERKLPVARERILAGTILSAEDLEIRWVSIPHDRGQLLAEIEEAVGKTLRYTLAAGQPLRHQDLASEILIEAGQPVTLVFEDHGLRIELQGEARQSGGKGDEITIFSKETRKRYTGRVLRPGIALWKRTL